jgi:hypothetical protein
MTKKMTDSQIRENQDPKENLDDSALEEASKKEEEIRQSVIEKYALDEAENADLIEQLIEDRLEDQKKLSTAIKQKIAYREKLRAQQSPKDEVVKDEDKGQKSEDKPQAPQVFDETKAREFVRQEMEEHELKSLDLSDKLKQEIKDYAKMKGVSVREAEQSDYIKFRKEEEIKAARIQAASPSSKHKGQIVEQDLEQLNVEDIDFSTSEGRELWHKKRAQMTS